MRERGRTHRSWFQDSVDQQIVNSEGVERPLREREDVGHQGDLLVPVLQQVAVVDQAPLAQHLAVVRADDQLEPFLRPSVGVEHMQDPAQGLIGSKDAVVVYVDEHGAKGLWVFVFPGEIASPDVSGLRSLVPECGPRR